MGFILTGIVYYSLRILLRFYSRLLLWAHFLFPSYPWGFLIYPLNTELLLLGFNLFHFTSMGTISLLWNDNWRILDEGRTLYRAVFRGKRVKAKTLEYLADTIMCELNDIMECLWLVNLYSMCQGFLLYVGYDVYSHSPLAEMYIPKVLSYDLPELCNCLGNVNRTGLQPMPYSIAHHNASILQWLWFNWLLILQQLSAATFVMSLRQNARLHQRLFPLAIFLISTASRFFEVHVKSPVLV